MTTANHRNNRDDADHLEHPEHPARPLRTSAQDLPDLPILDLPRRVVDTAALKQRPAREDDASTRITAPTILKDAATGALVAIYVAPIAEDCRALVGVLRSLAISRVTRSGGMRSWSRGIGYHARHGLRENFCAAASLADEDAAAHDQICSYAPLVARYYARYAPAIAAQHREQARLVQPEWRLEGTMFTSGVVNRDNPLPYHHDGNNVPQVLSGMLGFRHSARGGHLVLPEYDVALPIADHSLTLFDARSLLHGVTPIRRKQGGYRYTIVFYAAEQMGRCLTWEEEVARIQQVGLEHDRRLLHTATDPANPANPDKAGRP